MQDVFIYCIFQNASSLKKDLQTQQNKIIKYLQGV